MRGQAWLVELLTECILEGFRLKHYHKPKQSDDWIDEFAVEMTKRYRERSLTIEGLAQSTGRSVRRVQQAFKERYDESPITYLNRWRILSATRLIKANPDLTISALMQRTGFSSRSLFNRMFKRFTGTTPSSWRNDAQS